MQVITNNTASGANPRRSFLLRSGVATAVVAGAAPVMATVTESCGVTLSTADNLCLRDVALSDFAPVVGQHFQAYAPGHAAMLRLVDASPVSSGPARPAHLRKPFSLTFEAVHGAALEEGIHEFTHATLGTLKLSLNQIGDTENPAAAKYEVVFG